MSAFGYKQTLGIFKLYWPGPGDHRQGLATLRPILLDHDGRLFLLPLCRVDLRLRQSIGSGAVCRCAWHQRRYLDQQISNGGSRILAR